MTTEQVKLKPCPFCGETERFLIPKIGGTYNPGGDISCVGCGAKGPFRDAAGARADAAERWDTRPNPPSPDAGERREAIKQAIADYGHAKAMSIGGGPENSDRLLNEHIDALIAILALSPAPDADTVMTEAQARDLLVDAMDNAGAFDPGEVVVSLGDAVKALLAASQVKADPPAPPLPEGAMLLTDFLDEFDKELAALEPDSTGRKPGEPFNPAGAIALGHELDHEDGGYPSPGGGSMTETKRGDAGE